MHRERIINVAGLGWKWSNGQIFLAATQVTPLRLFLRHAYSAIAAGA